MCQWASLCATYFRRRPLVLHRRQLGIRALTNFEITEYLELLTDSEFGELQAQRAADQSPTLERFRQARENRLARAEGDGAGGSGARSGAPTSVPKAVPVADVTGTSIPVPASSSTDMAVVLLPRSSPPDLTDPGVLPRRAARAPPHASSAPAGFGVPPQSDPASQAAGLASENALLATWHPPPPQVMPFQLQA